MQLVKVKRSFNVWGAMEIIDLIEPRGISNAQGTDEKRDVEIGTELLGIQEMLPAAQWEQRCGVGCLPSLN